MPIEIQRPSPVDVTKNNPSEVIYLQGSEFVDGSLRFFVVDERAVMQERFSGVWQTTTFDFDQGYVLANDLSILFDNNLDVIVEN